MGVAYGSSSSWGRTVQHTLDPELNLRRLETDKIPKDTNHGITCTDKGLE